MSLTPSEIEARLQDPGLLDDLAAIEHQRWGHWQAYVHKQCEPQDDGSLKIPAELALRWARQIGTEFVDLTEDEKQSDREQVLKYLPTISSALLEGE